MHMREIKFYVAPADVPGMRGKSTRPAPLPPKPRKAGEEQIYDGSKATEGKAYDSLYEAAAYVGPQ